MDRPTESFAKSVTKQRFQELINPKPLSANRLPLSRNFHSEFPENEETSRQNDLLKADSEDRKDGDGRRRLSRDASDAARRLRSRADNIRKVLDDTAENENHLYNKKPLRRPRRPRTQADQTDGVTNESFELEQAASRDQSRQIHNRVPLEDTVIQTPATPPSSVSYSGPRRRKESLPPSSPLFSSIGGLTFPPSHTLSENVELTNLEAKRSQTSRQPPDNPSEILSVDPSMSDIQSERRDLEESGQNVSSTERQTTRLMKIRSKIVTAAVLLAETVGGRAETVQEISELNSQTETRQGTVETEDRQIRQTTDGSGNCLAVHIHRTDRVTGDIYLREAVVRVSVVDSVNGRLLRKKHRANGDTVMSPESEPKTNDFAPPMLTRVCDLSGCDVIIPSWEETLLYSESWSELFHEDSYIVFFELLNSTQSAKTNKSSSSGRDQDASLHHVAWAFLKLARRNKKSLSGHRVRLQLYLPGRIPVFWKKLESDVPIVYQWWKSKQRHKFPSTLYVTLSESGTVSSGSGGKIDSIKQVGGDISYRDIHSLLATGSPVPELTGEQPYRDGILSDPDIRNTKSVSSDTADYPWSRLPHQPCLIPNTLVTSLDGGHRGTSAVKFSHDGRSLACGGLERTGIGCVSIYEYPSCILKDKMIDFRGIVYDLEWSKEDAFLLTACGDGTAKIWALADVSQKPVTSLPHPGFVYCARFHPKHQTIIATGCYDGIIRIWKTEHHNAEYVLLQELTGHEGLVNVLLFEPSGKALFSGGSDGFVYQWQVAGNPRSTEDLCQAQWQRLNSTATETSESVTVSDLQWSSKTKQLVSLDQRGQISFLDQKSLVRVRRISCSRPARFRIRFTVSPCGSHLYVGNVDSLIQVFDVLTGKLRNSIPSGVKSGAPMDIDYHPFEHALVCCALGSTEKVNVWGNLQTSYNSPSPAYEESRNQVTSPLPEHGRDLFSPDSVKADKISDVIQKLDSITHDLKMREMRRQRKKNPPLTTVASSISFPIRSPHWAMRRDLLPSPVGYQTTGFLPNLSRI